MNNDVCVLFSFLFPFIPSFLFSIFCALRTIIIVCFFYSLYIYQVAQEYQQTCSSNLTTFLIFFAPFHFDTQSMYLCIFLFHGSLRLVWLIFLENKVMRCESKMNFIKSRVKSSFSFSSVSFLSPLMDVNELTLVIRSIKNATDILKRRITLSLALINRNVHVLHTERP